MHSSQTQPEDDDQGDQRHGELLQEDHHNANTGPEDTVQSMYEYCNGAESPELDQASYSNGTSGRELLEEEELLSGEQAQQKTRTRAREQNKDKLKNGQWVFYGFSGILVRIFREYMIVFSTLDVPPYILLY